MMKKRIILLSTLVNFTFVFSQVGINTENPQGIFNIDGGKDNPATGSAHTATQQINDFTVLANGNVGIGTIAPSQKLEIQTGGNSTSPITGFKLQDGNQGHKKVLTSDSNGIGTWEHLLVGTPINGTFNWSANTAIGNDNWNSIASLVIPPGPHNIFAKVHFIVDSTVSPPSPPSLFGSFVRFYIGTKDLGSNNNNANDTPLLGSSNFSLLRANEDFELNQQFIYNNTTNSNVTLYINIQSDYQDLARSIYTYDYISNWKGVLLVENFFFGVPIFN
jgi:hypothetical protein